AFEFFMHLLLILTWMKVRENDVRFSWLVVSLPIAFMMSYNLAFLFPAVVLDYLLSQRPSRRRLGISAAVSAVILVEAFLLYHLVYQNAGLAEEEAYWAKKYGVFCANCGLWERF